MAGSMAFGGPQHSTLGGLPPHPEQAGHRWRPALLLRVLLHRSQLDRQLAEGVDPNQTPALSLRARQLQSMRLRRSLANGLKRDVEMTEGRRARDSAALPVNREEVIRARPLLLRIVERLRQPGAVSPRGVAMVRWLLSDAASPIFSPGWSGAKTAPGALESQARTILAVFDGRNVDLAPGDRAHR
jgi:hypothetical protein